MFHLGDLVVLKKGYDLVLEVANFNVQECCDVWNEDDYFLGIGFSELRYATAEECDAGHRITSGNDLVMQ
ncbi:hypothetical protein QLH32_17110 [Acinetobacter corruptisaponis]|uniref:Uncharacterized protein n=1 Tax=Acinetobacter corruptisaponis TaxID=3045147 RepID=A0ABY8S1Y4_9GAMM|nr:hypothetical protein [Acinetobacter sp. KCTC 92772]WHP05698.1 hypothetical protein QLH32_17110 [Acinetobacter sp. KCTC 92772]